MKKLLMIILALLIAIPAFAVDYWNGPPQGAWTRGEPGTTYEHFMFSQPVPGGPPEEWLNPYGQPMYELEGMFEYGEWPCPTEMDPDGVVSGFHCIEQGGGTIRLRIPNTEFIDGEKKIFIQITSSKGPTSVTATGLGAAPGGYTSGIWPTGLPQIQWGTPAPYGGIWYTYNYGLMITPNPQMEEILITVPFCTVVDQIVVDTICTGTVAAEKATMDGIKALFR